MVMAVFWDVGPGSVVNIVRLFRDDTLMMDAVSASEASVSIYQTTWRNIPEGGHLYCRLRENLKSYIFAFAYD
jgi:hypothetical protein